MLGARRVNISETLKMENILKIRANIFSPLPYSKHLLDYFLVLKTRPFISKQHQTIKNENNKTEGRNACLLFLGFMRQSFSKNLWFS